MNLDNLHPVARDHAVESVHFVVEWASPLTDDAVLALGNLASKFKNIGFPHMVPQKKISFKVEGDQPAMSTFGHGIGGFIFGQRPQPEACRQVAVTAENCAILIPDYTRWDSVFAAVKDILKIVLNEVGPSRPLRSIGVQYNDAFVWTDEPAAMVLTDIFNEDFIIPTNVFKLKGLWHVHHGYFESGNSTVAHAVLQNVNVDLVDTDAGRRIQIIGSHKANLVEPLWQSHMKNKDAVEEIFVMLHQMNKSMLRALLTEPVRARINLDG